MLTDPVWSNRCSAVQFAGPLRLQPPPISLEELPIIDVVTISHNHYDHLDTATVEKLIELFNPQFVVPLGMKSQWFAQLKEVDLSRVFELNWYESVHLQPKRGDGPCQATVEIVAVPVQHWSMRTGFDKFKQLWCGFVSNFHVDGGTTRRVFHSGDTGYCEVFKEIGKNFGRIDAALIPIGAYEPRNIMKPQHVDPEEAVQIHIDIRSKFSFGMHWGTFILTDEPIDEPPRRLAAATDAAGLKPTVFRAPRHGETFVLTSAELDFD